MSPAFDVIASDGARILSQTRRCATSTKQLLIDIVHAKKGDPSKVRSIMSGSRGARSHQHLAFTGFMPPGLYASNEHGIWLEHPRPLNQGI